MIVAELIATPIAAQITGISLDSITNDGVLYILFGLPFLALVLVSLLVYGQVRKSLDRRKNKGGADDGQSSSEEGQAPEED